MNRGPRPYAGRPANTESFGDKLATRLGADAPEWLQELAMLCDRVGLRQAAGRMGYSAATISQVISGSYRGDVGRIEEMVRGALMGATVMCPRLDEMSRNTCLEWQRKPFAATSSLRVEMYHSCRSGCPHSKLNGGDDAE